VETEAVAWVAERVAEQAERAEVGKAWVAMEAVG